MKPPPLLLGATLLFWGWQSGFLVVGAAIALVLEGARFIKARWEFSDDDFARIWTFCAILLLGSLVYAFTANDVFSSFSRLVQNPSPGSGSSAGSSSARSVAAMLRWLPMIFFPFIAAQTFSTREAVPLTTISLIMRLRWKRAKELGQPMPGRDVPVGYPYVAVCLLAASMTPAEDTTYFWGLCALLTWMFWVQRSRRFAVAVWATVLATTIALGYYGQSGIGYLQRYIESLNPQFLGRFARQHFDPTQSRTMLGNIGDLKASGKIIIRLEPKDGSAAPPYLRASSYRSYKSRVWYAGPSKDDFTDVREEPVNSRNWPLLPAKTNTDTVNIACYLDGRSKENNLPMGLLPLPGGVGRLENLPAYRLQQNSAGAVLAEGPGLMMFDAEFGPGQTIDSPPEMNDDLEVLPSEIPGLDKVISELHLKSQNTEIILSTLGGFFADKFTYSTWQSSTNAPGEDETPLSAFLLRTRSGHCEYFATATVLLLRQLGIPARYAVGFAVHETAGDGYVVRERDAHAWCLVWNREKQIWQDFDTTPASWVQTEGKHASSLQWLSDWWSWMKFQFSKFWWGQTNLRQYLFWLFIPVLGLMLYQIIFRRGRKRRRKKAATEELPNDWPGLDSDFYQLEKKLAERGVPRGESEPLSDWLLRVLDTPDMTELRRPLQELLRLHYRYRFDPQGLSETDRESLKRETQKCLESLMQMKQTATQ